MIESRDGGNTESCAHRLYSVQRKMLKVTGNNILKLS